MDELICLLIDLCNNRITSTETIKKLVNDHFDKLTPNHCYNLLLNRHIDTETSLKLYNILKRDINLLEKLAISKRYSVFNYSTIVVKAFILSNVSNSIGEKIIDNWTSIRIQYDKTIIKNQHLNNYAKERVDSILVMNELSKK